MLRKIHALFPSLAVSGLLALVPAEPAAAQQVSFTVTGTMIATGQGYTAGQPVSLSFVLDPTATALVGALPVPNCCTGTLAWQQDLFTEPQLWSAITGTGLSGFWQPPIDRDLGRVVVGFSKPALASNPFQMGAITQTGFPSGLFAPNGLTVSSVQISASFLGLDPVGSYGEGNIFSSTVPDPTLMFLSMVGTYTTDRLYGETNFITTSGASGGVSDFRVNQLIIAAVVPEPGGALLLTVGCGALGWLVWRRRALPPRSLAL